MFTNHTFAPSTETLCELARRGTCHSAEDGQRKGMDSVQREKVST